MQTCSSELWKIASRGGGWVKMNHLRTVQTRNVVVSNVMMSNAPKMTCPGDPRAQTHTQIVRAYLRCAQPHIQYKTLSVFLVGQEGGRAGEFLPPAQKTKKKCHELISHT